MPSQPEDGMQGILLFTADVVGTHVVLFIDEQGNHLYAYHSGHTVDPQAVREGYREYREFQRPLAGPFVRPHGMVVNTSLAHLFRGVTIQPLDSQPRQIAINRFHREMLQDTPPTPIAVDPASPSGARQLTSLYGINVITDPNVPTDRVVFLNEAGCDAGQTVPRPGSDLTLASLTEAIHHMRDVNPPPARLYVHPNVFANLNLEINRYPDTPRQRPLGGGYGRRGSYTDSPGSDDPLENS